MIIEFVALLAIIALLLGLTWWRTKLYLMFFQQEEYDSKRFLNWMVNNRAVDLSVTGVCLVALLAYLMSDEGRIAGVLDVVLMSYFVVLVSMAIAVRRTRRYVTMAKKALVMTDRAMRLQGITMMWVWVPAVWVFWGIENLFSSRPEMILALFLPGFLLQLQAVPFALLLSNKILRKSQRKINQQFIDSAKEIMDGYNGKVIAITGSYGKTSTKHILGHVLSSVAPTLITPGSVNTELGITRIINEKLKPEHTFFVVEMGAYGPGSIAKLCRLTPPDLALVTAVGSAHMERFKSVETVFHAKFEIADAVATKGGTTIVNASGIPTDLLDKRVAEQRDKLVLCEREGAPTLASVEQTRTGLAVEIAFPGGATERFETPLYGTHHAGNILLAVTAAREVGLPIEAIRAALKSVPQIRHRLEVTLATTGASVIDDAYNANPIGFAAGLELLDQLTEPPGRRVLITPGMVELGTDHDEAHLNVGRKAGECADIVLAVTPDRIPTFIEGFEETKGVDSALHRFDDQASAETWLKENTGTGDVVLFENNLPDLYEAKLFL